MNEMQPRLDVMPALDLLCRATAFDVLDDDGATMQMLVPDSSPDGERWHPMPDDVWEELVRLEWVQFFAEAQFEVSPLGRWHWAKWDKQRQREERKRRRASA